MAVAIGRAPATAVARAATPATRKLVSGPTIAIRNSTPGKRGSSSSWETPPKTCSVMPDTVSPERRATIACDSSCRKTDTKSRSAATAPPTQWAATGTSGSTCGK